MKKNRGNRHFSDKPVEVDTIIKILEAGCAAPSGAVDGVHIFVVDREEKRHAIHRMCVETEKEWMALQPVSVRERIIQAPDYDPELAFLIKAPLLLVVSTRPRDPEFPYAVESAFITIGYMLVMAQGIGLIAAPFAPSILHETDVNRLNTILKLPPGESIQALLPVGYPEIPMDSDIKWSRRNIFLNEFGKNYFQK